VAPNAPSLTSPIGGAVINPAVPNWLSFVFSGGAGDTQSAFDLRYRIVGAPTWTDAYHMSPNAALSIAAAVFADEDYEWQVRCYGATGLVGPYSTSGLFTATTPAATPTITTPAAPDTVITTMPFDVVYSSPNQTTAEIRAVADLAGDPDPTTIYYGPITITDAAARTAPVTFAVNGRTEHIQVRVCYLGSWTPWGTCRVSVAMTAPAVPIVTVTTPMVVVNGVYVYAGYIAVGVATPDPGFLPAAVSMEVWRTSVDGSGEVFKRIADGLDPTAEFLDYWVTSGVDYTYRARVLAAGGAYSESGDAAVYLEADPVFNSGWADYLAGARGFFPAGTNYWESDPGSNISSPGFHPWNAAEYEAKETAPPVALPTGLTACTKIVHTTASEPVVNSHAAANLAVAPGEVWMLSGYVHCASETADVLSVEFQTYLNGALKRSYWSGGMRAQVDAVNPAFVRVSVAITVAADENQLMGYVRLGAGTGTFYLTGMQLQKTAILEPYFDGSFDACAWTGTEYLSTSTREASKLAFLLEPGTIVFDGDSLSAQGYPAAAVALLAEPGWTSVVEAVGGQAVQTCLDNVATVDARYAPGNVVVLWVGTNDYGVHTPAELYAHIVTYCQGRQAVGFKVVTCTLTPRSNDPAVWAFRDAVNALIRAGWATYADGLVDIGADPVIGYNGAENDTTYYTDLTHMTTAGQLIVAGLVAAALDALPLGTACPVLSLTGGTIAFRTKLLAFSAAGANYVYLNKTPGAGTGMVPYGIDDAYENQFYVANAGAEKVAGSAFTRVVGTPFYQVARYASDTVDLNVGGTAGAQQTGLTAPVFAGPIYIGATPAGTGSVCGYLSALVFHPARNDDAWTLAALVAGGATVADMVTLWGLMAAGDLLVPMTETTLGKGYIKV
jgi:hypothetical protein